MSEALTRMLSSVSSPVEMRLLAEYGAVFLTTAAPPPRIIFADSEEVEAFQSTLATASAALGEHTIELQREAMETLLRAADEMKRRGGAITARAEDAGRRSYADTVRLWTRNVTRGLAHWQEEGRIELRRAQQILSISPFDQVAPILEMEEREQIFFGTFFDKSILYSVAAPGASQHLAMLAFDVAEFESSEVERVLASQGWFRTVASDFPHFTYLGRIETELPSLSLKKVARIYKEKEYFFWVPDL